MSLNSMLNVIFRVELRTVCQKKKKELSYVHTFKVMINIKVTFHSDSFVIEYCQFQNEAYIIVCESESYI